LNLWRQLCSNRLLATANLMVFFNKVGSVSSLTQLLYSLRMMPYLTERHTGIHIGIWCPGQALCPELWESLKRNYRSHEMSVDPYCIPWHCAEISFTDFKDKFKSCHVCFVKNDNSPSKPIFLCRNDCQ